MNTIRKLGQIKATLVTAWIMPRFLQEFQNEDAE
jgi:hypothetical protein